ncbi:hypothetical protein NUM3379_14310 [Kineococcus sp. NUM-3379]
MLVDTPAASATSVIVGTALLGLAWREFSGADPGRGGAAEVFGRASPPGAGNCGPRARRSGRNRFPGRYATLQNVTDSETICGGQ